MKSITCLITATVMLTLSGAASADKKIYDTRCASCHATGIAGSPKFGDKAAWAPFIATGMDTMMAVAIKGKGAMPPKGGCSDCTDAQMKSTIQYMVDAAK